jgi:glycosyltransferase involved in cell wall biosynthesis
MLSAFLEATIDPDGPGERMAATLLDLRDAFRRWDPSVVWRSSVTWDVIRDHLLVRTPDGGGDLAGGQSESWPPEEFPTVGEATTAMSWLGGVLSALSIEVPRVDLVHATAAGFSALPGILAQVERGTPLLLSEHAVAPRDAYLALDEAGAPFHLKRFAGDVSGAVARTVYRMADRIAPACRHTMRWELAYGAPRSRMTVVEPGLNDERYRPLELPRSDRPTVIQASPIDPESDPDTLLGVAERVRGELSDVLFLHAGPVLDQSTWERVRALRHERGLEDTVRFAGAVEDVPGILALGDVALITSRSEILPLAVVEASLCGLPVVATDTGGVREAVNGAGIVAAVGDADGLAEGVAATLRVGPEQRDRLRLAAREQAVVRFGLQRFLRDHRALYADLGMAGLAPASPPIPEHEFAASPEPLVVEIPDRDVVEIPDRDVVEIPDLVAPEVAGDGDHVPHEPVTPTQIDVEAPPHTTEEVTSPQDVVPGDTEPARPVRIPSAAEAATIEAWLAAAWAQHHEPHPGPAPAGADDPREGDDAPGRAHPVPQPSKEQGRRVPPRHGGIRERLRDPDPAIRVSALRDLEDPSAADAAAAAMADDVPQVRREAVRTLGRLDGPRAWRWLSDAISGDLSPEVRGEAVEALAALITRRRPGGRGDGNR